MNVRDVPLRENDKVRLVRKTGVAPDALNSARSIDDEDEMAEKIEGPDAEWMRRFAAARGLGRAHALFPDTVAAAFARASQAMSTLPATFPPLTEPAVTFDPAAFTVPE